VFVLGPLARRRAERLLELEEASRARAVVLADRPLLADALVAAVHVLVVPPAADKELVK